MTDKIIYITVEQRGLYPLSPEIFACITFIYAALAPMLAFDHLPWSLVTLLIGLTSILLRRAHGLRFKGDVVAASDFLYELKAR